MAVIKKNIKQEALNMIHKINEKNPYYLVIGVLVLVLLLDYFLVMQFQLGALRKIGPKVTEIKSDIERFEMNKGRIDKYRKDITALDEKLGTLESRLKTTEDISAVLESLSRIANKNKVFVEQILPDTNLGDPVLKNKDGKYFLMPITIDAKSSYHHFGHFLNDLEERGPLMKISKLKISTNATNPRQHTVKLVVEAIIFEPKIGVVK